jgi:mono/diheme cytochrome c family protein
MGDQPSIGPQESPLQLPPQDSVPVSRPPYLWSAELLAQANPVPADPVSLQRGAILFSLNCAVCHGLTGQGDGPVVKFWGKDAQMPANLTTPQISKLPDSAIYTFISQGIGAMPPLRENLTERQRWDVVNHVRTLQTQPSR